MSLTQLDYSRAISDAVADGARDHHNACSVRAGRAVSPVDLTRNDVVADGYRDTYPDASDEQISTIVDAWAHAWVGDHAASCIPCACDSEGA
jgi:hypothetical protein